MIRRRMEKVWENKEKGEDVKKTGRKGELKARFGGKRGIGKYSCYITLILT